MYAGRPGGTSWHCDCPSPRPGAEFLAARRKLFDYGHEEGAHRLSRRRSTNQRPGRRSGRFQLRLPQLNSVVSQIQGGTIKAIPIARPERADVIKHVPTTKDGGLPDFQVSGWNAIFAPRNLPQDIQAKLSDALVKALDDQATDKRLVDIGCIVPNKADRTPQALQKRVESEMALWSSVLKAVAAK
jgi:tripartite-type tricarboxylate transporter receptor subunit TctC